MREEYMINDVIKVVNAIVNWLINPQEDFNEVINYVNNLCSEYKVCIDIGPTRTAMARAIMELMITILSRCECPNDSTGAGGYNNYNQ